MTLGSIPLPEMFLPSPIHDQHVEVVKGNARQQGLGTDEQLTVGRVDPLRRGADDAVGLLVAVFDDG